MEKKKKGTKMQKSYEEACLVFDIRRLFIKLEQAQLKGTREQVESILVEIENKIQEYRKMIEVIKT